MRRKFAKGLLYALAYDIKHLLDLGESPREVFNMAKKKLRRDFKKVSYVKIDWSKNPKPKKNSGRSPSFPTLEEEIEHDATSHSD